MPPFTWQPPPGLDPNGTLADLMMRGPDALARAAAAKGQIWGQGIAQAGQDIAAVPQQMEQQKMRALQEQDIQSQIRTRDAQAAATQQEAVQRGLQIKETIAHQNSVAAFEGALKNPANYNDDGTPNNEAITKELRTKDIPAWQQWQTISTTNEKNTLEHAKLLLEIQNGSQSLQDKQRAAQQVQSDYLGKLAYVGVQTLDEKPNDPLHARDTALASIARAAADGVIGEQQAKSLSMQLIGAGPDQIRQILVSAIPPELKGKLDKEAAETQKALADAAEARSKAAAGPNKPLDQQLLEAIASGNAQRKSDVLATIAADANAKRDPDAQAQIAAIRSLSQQAAQDRLDNENPKSAKNQQKFEQEYRTVLQRGLSSRSGGLGLEDAKVQQANHLMSIFEQNYDPKTGEWNIPRVQLNELALGLARLTAPGGQAGEGMLREFQQRTAKGDLAGALTYITGQPVAANTQAITQMLKDSIERQGKTALQNREGEMAYLRGLAPTDLDEGRRTKLEATSLNPLRQSRVIQNDKTGERKLQVSIDGGQTWR